jgi:hypothetical protein
MKGIRRGFGPAWVMAAAMAIVLAGCNSKLPSPRNGASGSPVVDTASPLASRYDLAKRCVVLKLDGHYVTRSGSSFLANGSDAKSAQRFYMQPSGLGRYLFYTDDKLLMTASGTTVSAVETPADGSDWTVNLADGHYTATTLQQSLSADSSGTLLIGNPAAPLGFEPASSCTAYPEMPTGIDTPTFKSQGIRQPVIGFAEVHSHMGMSSEMSDGSGNVGPSSGGVLYGQPINRFGVIEALKNCEAMHGPRGTLSAENIILDQNPTETHDTVGWPTFVDWPKRDSMLHQQMYYRWIERAWKAGLRTMTIHGTTIQALCNIAKATYGGVTNAGKNIQCVDQDVGSLQVKYMYDVQNYVDAQEGGPGKGWFRIVKTPEEARAVIADGKLAVILGLEFSNIFHCRVQFLPGGAETSDCTKADIDREIDESWDLGVRQVFPYHDVDSALGGTGIFSSILNEVGFTDTHGFWKTYPCENGGTGPTYFYEAGAVMETSALTAYTDPITSAITAFTNGTLPVYGPGRQCNARTVTDLGKYAIDKIMKKGFVLDIDHAEIKSKQYMLDQGAKTTPYYPMISGHGGQGGINNAQAVQIIRQGGIIYPAIPNGKDFAAFVQKLKPIWAASGTTRPLAVGYGADTNGLRTLPASRGAGSEPIHYPFTLFQGAGWGPQYAAAGIAPITVQQLAIPGGKRWNMDEEGMSHYGLVPDIVEEARIEGGEETTTALYRSAETYLQLWEQTQQASVSARQLPTP